MVKQQQMFLKIISLNAILVSLAVIAGWTLSKATVIGKVGIHFLHREYLFWIGWGIVSIFFIKLRNDKIETNKNPG